MRVSLLLIAAVALGVMIGGCSRPVATDDAPSASPSVPALSPAPPPTEAVEARPDVIIIRCLPAEHVTIAVAAAALRACPGAPPMTVLSIDGDVPALLVEIGAGFRRLFIAWQTDEGWQMREPADPYPLGVDYHLVSPGDAVRYVDSRGTEIRYADRPAREQTIGGTTYLGVLFTDGAYSDQTKMRLALFAFEQRTWRVRWMSARDPSGRLSNINIEFGQDGLETVEVTGNSWLLPDEKSNIFEEVNAGPHRVFHVTLALRDGQYVQTAEQVEPSPYNTLVEFVYALRHGDRAAAASRTTDPALVDELAALGLGTAFSGGQAFPEGSCCFGGPIVVSTGVPRPVRVTFVERDGEWFISGASVLEPAP